MTDIRLFGYSDPLAARAGRDPQWVITDAVRQDEDGILTDWEWWEITGTGLSGYGHLLIIKHNNDYLSAYGHNDRLLAKEGDTVSAGL